MLRHFVCARIADPEKLAIAKDKVYEMCEKLDYVFNAEAGLDVLHAGNSYDLGFTMILKDKETLDRYIADPLHVELAQYLRSVRQASAMADYYIG